MDGGHTETGAGGPADGPDADGPARAPARSGVGTAARVRIVAAVVAVAVTLLGATVLRPGGEPPVAGASGRGDTGRTGTFPALAGGSPSERSWSDPWTTSTPRQRQTPALPVAVGEGYVVQVEGALALVDRDDGRVRWRTELDVAGASWPLDVGHGRVVVAGADEVSMLDTADGRRRWRASVPELDGRGGLAVLGDTLVVTGGAGAVVFLDAADGTRRATRTARGIVGGVGTFVTDDGPVVVGDHVVVILRSRSDARGTVVALRADGEVAWVADEPIRAWTGLTAAAGVVVATAEDGLVALDADSGEVAWRWRAAAGEDPSLLRAVAASPDGRELLVLSGWPIRRVLRADNGTLVVSENADPLPLDDLGAVDAAGRVAAMNHNGLAEVIDVARGRTVASRVPAGGRMGRPLVDGDRLVTGLAGGVVVSEPLGADGGAWRAEIAPVAGCGVVAAGGTVVVADAGLRAHDAATGVRRWAVDLDIEPVGEVGVGGDVVLAVDRAGVLTARDRGTGAVRWTAPVGGQPVGSPAVSADTVIVGGGTGVGLGGGTRSGYVRALDLRDGDRRWFVNTAGPLAHAPTVADGRVVVATTTGELQALDLGSGEERWRTTLAETPVAPPVQRGPHVVVVTSTTVTTFVAHEAAVTALATTDLAASPALVRAPAVTDEMIVLRGDSRSVRALDLATHRERWRTEVPDDALTTPPTVAGTRVLAGGQRALHVLDGTSGRVEARLQVDAPLVGAPLVSTAGIAACQSDGRLVTYR